MRLRFFLSGKTPSGFGSLFADIFVRSSLKNQFNVYVYYENKRTLYFLIPLWNMVK